MGDKMYKYLKRNRFSTQTSIIKNDAQQPVGMISKVYKNFIQKCIGYLTLGLKLNQYEICDVNNNSIAYIKVSRYMEKKHFKVEYHDSKGRQCEALFDKQSNGYEETYGILKIDGIILNIHANEKHHTTIKDIKRDTQIASWKQIGDYAYAEGNDGLFKEHQLLYILIMHAFANTYVSKRQTNLMFPGPPV